MKKTRSRLFYVLAVLLGALFVLACLAGFAACGNSDEPEEGGGDNGGGNGQTTTYRFEAEDAVLWAEEAQLWGECNNEIKYGSYMTGMGVIFGYQTVYGASGDAAVGYVAHNHPTATFKINSSKAVSGVKLTLTAASLDIGVSDNASEGAFALMTGWINDYSGSDHKILSVNGTSVALSGKLDGYGSLFNGAVVDDEGNAVGGWDESENALAVDHFGTLTATIDLKEGDNEIVLTHDGAGVSWDCIEIETDATLTMTKTDNTGFDSNKGTYVPNTSGGTGDDDDEEEEETFSRFVTGPYVEGTSVDAYYLYPNPDDPTVTAMFTGSEVTSVTYAASADPDDDLTGTYTINGKSAVMDDNQVKAFWGAGYEDYIGDEYLTVTLLADKGETVTVYTDKSPNGITLDGDSNTLDDTFFTRVQDVTTPAEGKQLYTFTVDEATYAVVLGKVQAAHGTITLAPTSAALFDASGSTRTSTSALDTESRTGRTGKASEDDADFTLSLGDGVNVKNFNADGDTVVYEVFADDAISDVTMTITAGAAELGGGTYGLDLLDYVASEHSILTVNGTVTGMSGTVYSGGGFTAYNKSFGTITATISLVKGVNYIVFTCDGTGLNLGEVVLDWDYEKDTDGNAIVTTVTELTISNDILNTSDAVEGIDGTTSITLAPTSAALFDASGSTRTSTSALDTESRTGRTGKASEDDADFTLSLGDGVNVKNFNADGDTVVYEVFADDAISDVTMTITAGAAELGGGTYGLDLLDYVASEHSILTVNGTVTGMSGTVYSGGGFTAYNKSFGTITATISLVKGVNYIVFTCDGTGLNLGDITLTWGATVAD